jgi:hypothetical protein
VAAHLLRLFCLVNTAGKGSPDFQASPNFAQQRARDAGIAK